MSKLKRERRWAFGFLLFTMVGLASIAWKADGHYDQDRLWTLGIWGAMTIVAAVKVTVIEMLLLAKEDDK